MANMSYCRFENTYRDLDDCLANLGDPDMSESEKHYARRIYNICRSYVAEFEDIEERDSYDEDGSPED